MPAVGTPLAMPGFPDLPLLRRQHAQHLLVGVLTDLPDLLFFLLRRQRRIVADTPDLRLGVFVDLLDLVFLIRR